MNRRTALSLFLALPAAALAHHGWSEYDSTRLLKLSGKVVDSGYEHPHGYIRLETPDKTWLCVLAPPSRMESRGLAKDALKPGASATVEGYANRAKPGEMRAERITTGGKTVELR
jgi:hypothetical protein